MTNALGRPVALQTAHASQAWARWHAAVSRIADPSRREEVVKCTSDAKMSALLGGIFAGSPFLSECLQSAPQWLAEFATDGPEAAMAACFEPIDVAANERQKTMSLLRRRRKRLAAVTALADLSGQWDLDRVTETLTKFADFAVGICVDQFVHDARHRGELGDNGANHGLIVLGMGKYGAFELNYSSDIDLIVLFDGQVIDYRGRESPMALAVKLARQLSYMLSTANRDGYVFRTDLRLRPHLPGHPLALSTDDAEIYFERQGQNWERAAFIKARAVAGDQAAGAGLLQRIQPFIWRRHLDFAAIRDIHAIKRQINAHRGFSRIAVAGHDIKVGRGGIREIEFFAQTQQLILGGKHPELRNSRTVDCLNQLADGRWIERQTAKELIEAYGILREFEHRLQMVADKQTQAIPAKDGQLDAFAGFAGFNDRTALEARLLATLRMVETHYAALFEQEDDLGAGRTLVFTGTENDRATLDTLGEMGFRAPDKVSDRIRAWHHGHIRSTRSARARELLTELTPTMLEALQRQSQPDVAFELLDAFFTNLPSGVQVFSLIRANPGLLTLLCDIMGAAPTLARKLADNTDLFDIIIDAGFLEPPPDANALASEFAARLIDAKQLEDVLDICRSWAHGRQFQAGLQVLLGAIDAERASAVHTRIAEVVIRSLLPRALDWLALKHGHIEGSRFAVIGLGKLGSKELTTGSDLDIILIYDDAGVPRSDGEQPLPATTYFARASQRLMSAISARTAQGRLYEIDTRLRPSGNAGPVACSIGNFRRYQMETAQTWEHQALTRARFVAGDESLGREVMVAIDEALGRPRAPEQIRSDIAVMNERIFDAHGSDNPWNLKYARGGIVDMEFAAQALRLIHGRTVPELAKSRTVDVLQAAGAHQLAPLEMIEQAIANLRLHQALQAVLRLTDIETFEPADAPLGQRDALVQAANKQVGLGLPLAHFAALQSTLVESQRAARQFFEWICQTTSQAENETS